MYEFRTGGALLGLKRKTLRGRDRKEEDQGIPRGSNKVSYIFIFFL